VTLIADPADRQGARPRVTQRWTTRRTGTRGLGVVAVSWLGYVVAHLILSGRWWPMLLPDLAPPLVFVAVPVFLALLAALTGRAGWRVLVLAGGALVIGLPQAGLNVAVLTATPVVAPPGAVRVVSWNTEYWHQTDDPVRFYRYLRSLHADVYLLQEYMNDADTPQPLDDVASLRREFPGYQIVAVGELLTLSRLPVVSVKHIDGSPWLPPYTRDSAPGVGYPPSFWTIKALRTDVLLAGRTVSLYNVHLPVQVDTGLNPLGADFYRVVHQQSLRRDACLRALTADLAGSALPALVAGDFNATPAMGELRRLSTGPVTAVAPTRSLYPTSWYVNKLPLWRLDQVFLRPGLRTYGYVMRPSQGLSDHAAQDLLIGLTNH
jgi:endonuclease/exonuclease/phosphatase (EEP) superfamily protein YafD